MMIDWVSIAKDWGLVLAFAAIFYILVRRMIKNSPPAEKSGTVQAVPAAQIQRTGSNDEITAAISAAINEYRKTNP